MSVFHHVPALRAISDGRSVVLSRLCLLSCLTNDMRNAILKWGLGIFFVIWGISGGYWAVVSVKDPMRGLGYSKRVGAVVQGPYFFPVLFSFVGIMCVAALFPLIVSSIRHRLRKGMLLKHGKKISAPIVSVRDTGMTVNNDPYVEVTVVIRPGIKTELMFRASRVSIPRPGDVIDVLYDPADPSIAMLAPHAS